MGRQGIPCAVGMAFFIAKFINFDFGKTNDIIFRYTLNINIYTFKQAMCRLQYSSFRQDYIKVNRINKRLVKATENFKSEGKNAKRIRYKNDKAFQ